MRERSVINADYLTYYFKKGTQPFRSLSDSTDSELLEIMRTEFSEDHRFHKNPLENIARRRSTEKWLRYEFIKRGGRPTENHPRYMVLGTSTYLEEYTGFGGNYSELRMPLTSFDDRDISFTYPDSVLSHWLAEEKNKLYYKPEYHGKVFLLHEVLALISQYEVTGEEWRYIPERKYDFFIEAQIWNLEPLMKSLPDHSKIGKGEGK